jgi:hypothetical protein
MGDHESGQEAGQLAIQALTEYVYASLFSKPIMPNTFLTLLREGVQAANQKLYQRNQEDRTTMGATAYVANVGDTGPTSIAKPAGSLRSHVITPWWPLSSRQALLSLTTSIPIPGAIKSTAAWADNLRWK